MRAVLTPGLTPFQRQRVGDVLHRVGLVPMGRLASVFIDVDRAAVRVLNTARPSREDCHVIAAELAGMHAIDRVTVGFCYGLAIGIRQGRTFAPVSRRSKQWISDEYRQLREHNRRAAARFIRQLLKAQGAPRPTTTKRGIADDVEAAQRWIREAGAVARRGRAD